MSGPTAGPGGGSGDGSGIWRGKKVFLTGHTGFKGDIRDLPTLRAAMAEAEPVIHLAAPALVRPSYDEPVETFATNVMGTVHVLEAERPLRSVQVILNVTSDKCYDNSGSGAALREGDRLGGDDPYSNSKTCAEFVTHAYIATASSMRRARRALRPRAPATSLAAATWARDRLVPDAMQAFLEGRALPIRNPNSVAALAARARSSAGLSQAGRAAGER